MASNINTNFDTTLPADTTGVYSGKVTKPTFVNTLGNLKSGLETAKEEVTALQEGKQDTLVSGESIKQINGQSILGSGDLVVSGGAPSTSLLPFTNQLSVTQTRQVMETHTITAPLNFELSDSALGCDLLVPVIADGTNVPTFGTGFARVAGSLAYENVDGVKNYLSLYSAGSEVLYSWSHRFGDLGLANAAPINTGAPVLDAAVVGGSPSMTNGTWTGSPTPTFTQSFTLDGVAIPNNYVYQAADIGGVVVGTVTATNIEGSVTAQSNTVTVTDAVAANYVDFANLEEGITKSGNSSTGFVYTADTSGEAWATQSNTKLPPDVEGEYLVTLTGNNGGFPMVVLSRSNNTAGFSELNSSTNYVIYVNAGGEGFYTVNLVAANGNDSVPYADGDIIRFQKTAENDISVSVSKDGGSNYTLIHTYGSDVNDLFPVLNQFSAGSIVFDRPELSGGVAV